MVTSLKGQAARILGLQADGLCSAPWLQRKSQRQRRMSKTSPAETRLPKQTVGCIRPGATVSQHLLQTRGEKSHVRESSWSQSCLTQVLTRMRNEK